MPGMTTRFLPILVVAAALVAGCGGAREIERDLEVHEIRTGWYDAGIVEGGMNKLVPTATVQLQNASDREISSVQLNAIFRRVGEPEAWGEHLLQGIDRDGLEPGATGEPLIIRSHLGYTGEQARAQMLQNRDFVDVRMELYGKHGSRTWVKLAEFPIERELIID
jgi:hypothetical protein